MSLSTLDELALALKEFSGRKELVKQLRKDVRKPVPQIRRAIKARALATLPKSGGLNRWAAGTRVTVQVRASARNVTATLSGGRNSAGGRSDIKRLDRGTIRHPSWGRRGRGQWHVQRVTSGFFTVPATDGNAWGTAVLSAVDSALKTIRG